MKTSSLKKLKQITQSLIDPSLPITSRIHKMQHEDLYIKRDDELGFGVSGSKMRKYASLIPFLKKSQKKIAITGSAYSNHTLSIIQLLKQQNIPYQLFLEKPKNPTNQGNFFFLSLLTCEEKIVWLDKIDNALPTSWTKKIEEEFQQEFLWVPLGGALKEGLPGALTLALDTLENTTEEFTHIFIDAGTGLTAAGLILGFHFLQKKTKIHVVLVAGSENEFEKQLKDLHCYLETLLNERMPLPSNYTLLKSVTAKSFGSCNTTILKKIAQTAAREGIFLDPIYTGKLFLTVLDQRKVLTGSILWIHSGGALSLSGFQDRFTF